MVVYEVRVAVEEDLAEAFEAYMRRRHLPEILATGCFQRIRFVRGGAGRFATWYEAARRADVDRYLAGPAAVLRADFLAHFPEGASVERDVWEPVQAWDLIPS